MDLAASCYVHHHIPATARCQSCDRPICEECAGEPRPTCPACRVDVRRRRRVLVATLALAVGALITLGWLVLRVPPPEDLATVAEARAAVARAPTDPALRVRLGQLAREGGLPDEAESAWREALRLDPSQLQAHRALAALYFEADRRAEARPHLAAVLAQLPDDGDALFILAQLDLVPEPRSPLDVGVMPAPDAALDAGLEATDAARADVGAALQAEQARADEAEATAAELDLALTASERDLARVAGRLDALTNQETPAGFCAIPIWPRPLGIAVEATANRNPIRLLYDPATPLTALTRAAAERLQIRIIDRTTRLGGPEGPVDFQRAEVREFTLGTRHEKDLSVVLCDACVLTGEDGILGADLVRAFNLQLQPNLGRLLVAGCQ